VGPTPFNVPRKKKTRAVISQGERVLGVDSSAAGKRGEGLLTVLKRRRVNRKRWPKTKKTAENE